MKSIDGREGKGGVSQAKEREQTRAIKGKREDPCVFRACKWERSGERGERIYAYLGAHAYFGHMRVIHRGEQFLSGRGFYIQDHG